MLDRLRVEVAGLRASRARLVLAADGDRRSIERALHEGVQQHLVALAVRLQIASTLADNDPAATKALLDETGRDVQQALNETAQLAQRIFPSLAPGGLAAALRAAAVGACQPAAVDVPADASCPPEVATTIYLCFLEMLERGGASASVTVRHEDGAIAFEMTADGARSSASERDSNAALERLRDRVEALGGWLAIGLQLGGTTRISGSLPLSR